jgi:gliding motility-associated protein GldM
MAGGKETPRQKMVGMMYLVLTALLALQVSSAIIQKFKFLDDSLQHAVTESGKRNVHSVEVIKASIEKNGNNPKDTPWLDKANQVRKESSVIIEEINKLRKDLITVTGGLEEDGSYKGAKEEDAVMIKMLGPEGSKKGDAYVLKKKLNEFVDNLRKVDPSMSDLEYLARDGKEDPMFKNDKEQKMKDFGELNFGHTPMVAALAVLSTKQAEVLKYESEALNYFASKVGASQLKFDNIKAMIKPDAKTIAAGTKYTAELFIAASSSSVIPTMSSTAGAVKVDPTTGVGKIEFTATGGAYDKEGQLKKSWEGKITIPSPSGGDTTFTIKEEYVVVKPIIKIEAGAISALYMNAANKLNVDVPALGSAYQPSFKAVGAQIITGDKKSSIQVVPSAKQVVLSVINAGSLLGDETLPVRKIPNPQVQLLGGGKPVDMKNGYTIANMPGALNIKVTPDEVFAQTCPDDAKYRPTKVNVILARGRNPVAQMTVTSGMLDISSFKAKARSGDRIIVEIEKMNRFTYNNQPEEVKLPEPVLTVQITD